MAEIVLTEAEVLAIQATQDAGEDAAGAGPSEYPYSLPNEAYASKMTRQEYKMLTMAAVSGAGQVFKDGDLTCGVRAIAWYDGDTLVEKSEATAQALTNNQTNYIYYTAAGTLTINITGFPSGPHLPLATIVTAAGTYAYDDITDCRQAAFLNVHPFVGITAGAEAANKRTITIQGAAHRQLVRVWIAPGNYGAPDATDNTVAVETGTTYEIETAHAAYKVISDASGTVAIGLTISGAATRYIMAEIDGRVYSSGQLDWAA